MKRTHETEDVSRTKRTKSTDIDLNYPFWVDVSTPSVNPPFVGPPLIDDNGTLRLRYTYPITVLNDSLTLAFNDTLQLLSNKLGIKISPSGPITFAPDGITIPLGNSLEYTNGLLNVNFKDDEPFMIDGDGIKIKLGNGLTIQNGLLTASVQSLNFVNPLVNSNGTVTLKIGNGLNIDSNGTLEAVNVQTPLTFNPPLHKSPSDEISIQLGSGLMVNPTGQLEITNVQLPLTFNAPFTLSPSNEVDINLGSGLRVNSSNQLEVTNVQTPLNFSSPLTLSANNVGLGLDNNTLEDNSGQLKVKLSGPLTSSSGGISISTNDSLSTSSNTLSVNLRSNGGLELNSGIGVKINSLTSGLRLNNEGLSIFAGWGVRVSHNGDLSVQYAPNSGLDLVAQGMRIKRRNNSGLLLDNNGIGIFTGWGVRVAQNGDLSVQYAPNSGLELVEQGMRIFYGWGVKAGSDGSLTLRVVNPITLNAQGIGLNISSGLEVNNNSLRVKTGSGTSYDSGGGIKINVSNPMTVSNNSIGLNIDNNRLAIDGSGKLTLVNNPNYNFVYVEYGSESLSSKTAVFIRNRLNMGFIRPFITLSWIGSTVQGVFRAKIVSTDFQNMTGTDPIKFGFVLDTMGQLSQSPTITMKYPDNQDTLNKVRPSNFYISHSLPFDQLLQSPSFLDSTDLKWLGITNFRPDRQGSFTQIFESKLYLSSLTYVDRAVLYFIIDINASTTSGGSFFTPASDDKQIYLIDIPFSYSGLKAQV